MKSKAYRDVDGNRIDIAKWLEGRDENLVHAGVEIGKESILGRGVKFDRRALYQSVTRTESAGTYK